MQALGLKVINPATPADARGLLMSAIRDPDPVIFIEHRLLYASVGMVPTVALPIPLGKAHIARQGDDVTIVAHSYGVSLALSACRRLEREHGVSAEVVDLRSTKPMDSAAILMSVSRTRRLMVVVTEGNVIGGVAAEVAALVAGTEVARTLLAPVRRVGVPDVPIPYSQPLEEAALPQTDDVVASALGDLGVPTPAAETLG